MVKQPTNLMSACLLSIALVSGCQPLPPISQNAPPAQQPVLEQLQFLSNTAQWVTDSSVGNNSYWILPLTDGPRIQFRYPFPSNIRMEIDGAQVQDVSTDPQLRASLEASGMGYYDVKTGPNYNSSTGWASELDQIHVPRAKRGAKAPITIAITDLSINPNYSGKDKTSNPLIITLTSPPLPPQAPSSLEIQRVAPTAVDIAWGLGEPPPIKSVKVERKDGFLQPYQQIAVLNKGATWPLVYQDQNVVAGTTYTYRVRANNDAGDSLYSNEASATIPAMPSPTECQGGPPQSYTFCMNCPGGFSTEFELQACSESDAENWVQNRGTNCQVAKGSCPH